MVDYHHPVCSCGSLRFDYAMVMFPMVWMGVCRHCGKETACHLKAAPAVPKPNIRRIDPDPYGMEW